MAGGPSEGGASPLGGASPSAGDQAEASGGIVDTPAGGAEPGGAGGVVLVTRRSLSAAQAAKG